MQIDELIIEMIYQARSINHEPTEILLGNYMVDRLKTRVNTLVWYDSSNKTPLEFMGIKITENYRYPFFIGIN